MTVWSDDEDQSDGDSSDVPSDIDLWNAELHSRWLSREAQAVLDRTIGIRNQSGVGLQDAVAVPWKAGLLFREMVRLRFECKMSKGLNPRAVTAVFVPRECMNRVAPRLVRGK